MSARASRRLAVLVSSALMVVIAACAPRPESREVAERFLSLYYGQSKLAEARALCTGAARARLDAEIVAVKGMAAPTDEPRVTWHLLDGGPSNASSATYRYGVDPRTADVRPLVATLALVEDGGRWLVSSISEAERGS